MNIYVNLFEIHCYAWQRQLMNIIMPNNVDGFLFCCSVEWFGCWFTSFDNCFFPSIFCLMQFNWQRFHGILNSLLIVSFTDFFVLAIC